MSNDLYNLIYLKLEQYRGEDYYELRAKIATELHDAVASLLGARCPEGSCYADVFLEGGVDRPKETELCGNISPWTGLKCELPKGHELSWKPNEGHRNKNIVWRHKYEGGCYSKVFLVPGVDCPEKKKEWE